MPGGQTTCRTVSSGDVWIDARPASASAWNALSPSRGAESREEQERGEEHGDSAMPVRGRGRAHEPQLGPPRGTAVRARVEGRNGALGRHGHFLHINGGHINGGHINEASSNGCSDLSPL